MFIWYDFIMNSVSWSPADLWNLSEPGAFGMLLRQGCTSLHLRRFFLLRLSARNFNQQALKIMTQKNTITTIRQTHRDYMVLATAKQIIREKFTYGRKITSVKQAATFLIQEFAHDTQERFVVLFLNNKNVILSIETVLQAQSINVLFIRVSLLENVFNIM